MPLLFLHLAAAGPGAGQSPRAAQAGPAVCSCPAPHDPDSPPGIVWQGPSPDLQLADLAGLFAPILWFSSDEPLLVARTDGAIPHPHPCDRAGSAPVVYYQVTQLVLRGGEPVAEPAGGDPRFFEKVDHFVLRYFFYYDEDRGWSPHLQDLEVVDVFVHLDRTEEGCYRARVARVEARAHGLDWYSNILRVEPDTAFPLTILVEEGKHANCTDRNADGIYTPGYDVNVRVNDAWGLRDVLGSSRLLAGRYMATMAKPRIPRFRLFPPEIPPELLPACVAPERRVSYDPEQSLGRYQLRPAESVPVCQPQGPEPERLLAMMRQHRFGPAWPARQFDSDVQRELSEIENVTRWLSAVNARLDSREVGVLAQGPGLDLREIWAVPRFYTNRDRWSVDLLFTPSASRWIDWYVATGFERTRSRYSSDPETDRVPFRGLGSEVGFKIRRVFTGKGRWAVLGYRFGGVRIGLRANGFSRLQQPRIVVEVGAGAF